MERFELASLAAQRVRLDFWRLLRSIWSATWEAAVRSELPSAQLLTYGEHADVAGEDLTPSASTAWSDRTTYGAFALGGKGKLVTAIWFEANDEELTSGFYFIDEKGNWSLSNALEIGPDWTISEEEWRVTRSGLVKFSRTATELDPTRLVDLSRAAVTDLAAAVR